MSGPIRRLHHDERGLVVGFFVRLALVLAIAAIAVMDGGSILWTKFQVRDLADSAALEAATIFRDTSDARAVQAGVERFVEERDPGMRVVGLVMIESDGTARVTLRKRATTIVARHLGFLKDFVRATSTGEADPPRF